MIANPECEVRIRCARDVEAFGVTEHFVIAIGGTYAQSQDRPGRDRDAADLGVARRGAVAELVGAQMIAVN